MLRTMALLESGTLYFRCHRRTLKPKLSHSLLLSQVPDAILKVDWRHPKEPVIKQMVHILTLKTQDWMTVYSLELTCLQRHKAICRDRFTFL